MSPLALSLNPLILGYQTCPQYVPLNPLILSILGYQGCSQYVPLTPIPHHNGFYYWNVLMYMHCIYALLAYYQFITAQ